MWTTTSVFSYAWIFSRAAEPFCTILLIIASIKKKRKLALTIKMLWLHFFKHAQKESRQLLTELWNKIFRLRFQLLRIVMAEHHLTLLSTSKQSTYSLSTSRRKKKKLRSIKKISAKFLVWNQKIKQVPVRWWQAYFLPVLKTTSFCIQPIWFLTLLLKLLNTKYPESEITLKVEWKRPQICLIWINNQLRTATKLEAISWH